MYSDYIGYSFLSSIASACGHPASTVKVTPPALDTCDGAFGKFGDIYGGACPREQGGDGEEKHTPASCGNAECADLISSINDNALAKMKTGLQV